MTTETTAPAAGHVVAYSKADFDESFVLAHLSELRKRWDAASEAAALADRNSDDGYITDLTLTVSWYAGTLHDWYCLDISMDEVFAEAEIYDMNEDSTESVGRYYAPCPHGTWVESGCSPAVCECGDYCDEHGRLSCEYCDPSVPTEE